jgi:hypothetical protein
MKNFALTWDEISKLKFIASALARHFETAFTCESSRDGKHAIHEKLPFTFAE